MTSFGLHNNATLALAWFLCVYVCSSRYTDISTHLHPAQPVSVLMLHRETSFVVTNYGTEVDTHCKEVQQGDLVVAMPAATSTREYIHVYITKLKLHSSCEIEDFVEAHLCKLCGILRSRVLRVVCSR